MPVNLVLIYFIKIERYLQSTPFQEECNTIPNINPSVVDTINVLPLEVRDNSLTVVKPDIPLATIASVESNNTSSAILSLDNISNVPQTSINEFLADWSVKSNIAQSAMNELLKGLRNHHRFHKLPQDSRTLLKIPSNTSKEIRTAKPGIYHNFGPTNGILKHLPLNINYSINNIQIVVDIDGCPKVVIISFGPY